MGDPFNSQIAVQREVIIEYPTPNVDKKIFNKLKKEKSNE